MLGFLILPPDASLACCAAPPCQVSMLGAGCFFLIGAGLQAGAHSLTQLILGRCVLGFGVGEWAGRGRLGRLLLPRLLVRDVLRAPLVRCAACRG